MGNIDIKKLCEPFDNLRERTFGEEDLFGGYESPITMIANQVETKIENDVMTAIQHYDIQVDKDELIKALNYDRQQYDKGYRDAQSKLKPMCKYLGKCMSHPDISREYYDWCDLYREDCNCQCCYR